MKMAEKRKDQSNVNITRVDSEVVPISESATPIKTILGKDDYERTMMQIQASKKELEAQLRENSAYKQCVDDTVP
jgi:hypothetical protein